MNTYPVRVKRVLGDITLFFVRVTEDELLRSVPPVDKGVEVEEAISIFPDTILCDRAVLLFASVHTWAIATPVLESAFEGMAFPGTGGPRDCARAVPCR